MTKYELRIAGECKQNLKICKKPQPWGQILSWIFFKCAVEFSFKQNCKRIRVFC